MRIPGRTSRKVDPRLCRLAALFLPAAMALSVPSPGAGQGSWQDGTAGERPRFEVGGGIVVGQPRGEFRGYVATGFGLDGFGRFNLDSSGIVGIRIDGGFLIYGRETQRSCLSATVGCRIEVEVITSNGIFSGGIGPEIALPLGPVVAYGGVSAGFSHFSTDSEVRGVGGEQASFASTRNFSDGGFAWNAASGMRIPVARGRTPVAVDLGVRWMQNGRREYLTEGDIQERPDGSLELNVRRSEADLLLWRVGVSVGVSGQP